MDISHIPFSSHIGISYIDNHLAISPSHQLENHIGTIHASALFTLAETASGAFLQEEFPNLSDKVIAILRSSNVKYKAPTQKTTLAYVSISEEEKDRFITQLKRKKRATISVNVILKDTDNTTVMQGIFIWFVTYN